MNLTADAWPRARDIYDAILEHYGTPEFRDGNPGLVCYYDPNDGSYGSWDGENIWINFGVCENWKDVVSTMIHEVWHHHQETEADDIAARDMHLFLAGSLK